jgi:hypothetical protein
MKSAMVAVEGYALPPCVIDHAFHKHVSTADYGQREAIVICAPSCLGGKTGRSGVSGCMTLYATTVTELPSSSASGGIPA